MNRTRLDSLEAMAVSILAHPASSLPATPAARLALIHDLCSPIPIFDADGEPTGEYVEPLLSWDECRPLGYFDVVMREAER